MKVKLKNNASLAEIGQVVDIKFAQANIKDGVAHALISLCKCRDFLLDLVYANKHPDVLPKYSIYGMSYDVTANPMDMSKTVFIVKFQNQQQLDNFHNNLGIIHRVEEYNKFQTTKVHAADDDPLMIVVEGDAYWCQSTLATNVYTMLIKFCAYSIDKSSSPYQSFDISKFQSGIPAEVSYLNQIGKNFFEFILQNMRSIIDGASVGYVNGFDEKQGIGQVHSYSGICTAHRNTLHVEPKTKFYTSLAQQYKNFKLEKELFSLGVSSVGTV